MQRAFVVFFCYVQWPPSIHKHTRMIGPRTVLWKFERHEQMPVAGICVRWTGLCHGRRHMPCRRRVAFCSLYSVYMHHALPCVTLRCDAVPPSCLYFRQRCQREWPALGHDYFLLWAWKTFRLANGGRRSVVRVYSRSTRRPMIEGRQYPKHRTGAHRACIDRIDTSLRNFKNLY